MERFWTVSQISNWHLAKRKEIIKCVFDDKKEKAWNGLDRS
ncbi:hypothetical protein [Paenisporosarcina sp. HGH0030]|nr:hypothetical protein [Paenisporosarcina sp. HGH0030]